MQNQAHRTPHSRRVSRLAALASAAALALSLAACSGAATGGEDDGTGAEAGLTLESLQETGTIRLGVADALPTTGADETPTGLVPELTALVFAELGVADAVAVPMDFGALIPSLQSGRIDVAAGGFYITKERCDTIVLADPSYFYLDGMAVPSGNPNDITTFEDVAAAGVDLGAVAGSATKQQAVDAGVDGAKVQEYPDIPTMLDALQAGRIGAASYDNVSIAYELAKPAYSDLSATDPVAPIVDGKEQPYAVSIGFPAGAEELAAAFNEKQAEMYAAGAFDELLAKWSLPVESARAADSPNIAELCGG